MPPDDLEPRRRAVRASTARFVESMAALGLTDAAMREPSLLPGWSRGHVLTHIARNADGIRRVVDAARHGEPAQMYPGGTAGRDVEIAAGAGRDLAALLADVRETAERLDRAWSDLPGPAWDVEAVTRTGTSPVRRLVQARWREVEIHWVDLLVGYGPADWPAAFVAPLLPSLADPQRLEPRLPAGVAVRVEATDSGQVWTAGSGDPVPVRAPGWALACWLVGRPAAVAGVLADPPVLSAWL
jgi:maleylpyruvate isomerase